MFVLNLDPFQGGQFGMSHRWVVGVLSVDLWKILRKW